MTYNLLEIANNIEMWKQSLLVHLRHVHNFGTVKPYTKNKFVLGNGPGIISSEYGY